MNNAGKGGFPVLGILGIVFITLKLIGEITLSWFWVLSPFWIPFAIIIGVAFIIFGIEAIRSFVKKISKRVDKERD